MNAQEYLRDLVAINSVRGNEPAVADYLEPILERLGFEVESYPIGEPRRNLLATRGENPTLCCYGHMDTVPVYDGWQTDPFTLTERDGRLYGLGTQDMKSGIAGLLAALERLPRNVPLKLVFCYDEEYDSEGAWLIARERADWFKGITHLLSVETGTAEQEYDTPTMSLGRRGRARYQVEIQGFSAHGGNNQRGVSAISLASQLVPRIESSPMPKHPQLGTGSQFVARIISENAGLSVPDRCTLEIERHFVHPETVDSVLKNYRQICNQLLAETALTAEQQTQVTIKIKPKPRTNPYMESYVTPTTDGVVRAARRLMREILGGCTITYGRSVADDNIMANTLGLSVIIIGPIGGNEHSPNEWIRADTLEQYADLYEAFLRAAA